MRPERPKGLTDDVENMTHVYFIIRGSRLVFLPPDDGLGSLRGETKLPSKPLSLDVRNCDLFDSAPLKRYLTLLASI